MDEQGGAGCDTSAPFHTPLQECLCYTLGKSVFLEGKTKLSAAVQFLSGYVQSQMQTDCEDFSLADVP